MLYQIDECPLKMFLLRLAASSSSPAAFVERQNDTRRPVQD